MHFNGERLRVLRRFHNHSQRDLGDLIGVTASAITKYERGGSEPTDVVLYALAEVLKVRPEFFYNSDSVDLFEEKEMNFRSRKTANIKSREKVRMHATLFGTLLETMSSRIVWPRFKLPLARVQTARLPESREERIVEQRRINEQLEVAARDCRTKMGIDVDAPIDNVTLFAEHAGIVVTTLGASVGEKVDAFSRYGTTNLAVINPARPSSTWRRFDLAHEICHGVCHIDVPDSADDDEQHAERERQAEYFAGALLLPRDAFAREFWNLGRSPAWPLLYDMKRRWGVHLSALVVRANQLGVMDYAELSRRFKYMSKAGWRKASATEPAERAFEQPQLFYLGLSRYLQETRKTMNDLADDMHWTMGLLEQIVGVLPSKSETPSIEGVASMDAFRQRRQVLG